MSITTAVASSPGSRLPERFRGWPQIALTSAAVTLIGVRWGAWLIAAVMVFWGPPLPVYVTREPGLVLLALIQTLALTCYPLFIRPWLKGSRAGAGDRESSDLLALGLFDVALALTLVHLSGGWGSPFYHLAITSLVVPAYLLRPSASALLAGAFVAAYMGVLATAGPGTDGDWAHQGKASLFGHVMTAVMVVGAVQFLAQINRQLVRERDEKEALAALEERARIAREIHDGIAQSIYMLSLNLEKAADLAPSSEPGTSLRSLVGLAKASLLEVRQYIFDLKPLLAGESGLVEALRSQAKEFSAVAGVPVDLSVSGSERRLPTEASTTIYRIAQEALANAFRHAEASRVGMNLSFTPDSVRLRVNDDGLGFANDREGGQGLKNMRHRAERLEGRFHVISEPGSGTAVEVSLPVKTAT